MRLIYAADDPVVRNGTYDREGYKPGERRVIERQAAEERARVAKARAVKDRARMARRPAGRR